MSINDEHLTINDFTVKNIDGRFPNMNRVFPTKKVTPSDEVGIDITLLKEICEAFKLMKFKGAVFTMQTADKPLIIRKIIDQHNSIEAILMPMRL